MQYIPKHTDDESEIVYLSYGQATAGSLIFVTLTLCGSLLSGLVIASTSILASIKLKKSFFKDGVYSVCYWYLPSYLLFSHLPDSAAREYLG